MWKRRLPLKVKVFAWLLLRRRLMTRSRLQRMVSDAPAECLLCARAVEDCQHLFFACPLAQIVWQATGVGHLVMNSDETFWRSLGGGTFRRGVEWQTIFATLWSIWMYKNKVIFKGRAPSADAILHSARGFTSFWH